ncbi:hypothetical protein JF50_07525 [Pseudoalteromonas luteoviolacea]|uniref:Uncharacterized protein n=1 Tax=Pseudoalteromonas luteoviolacea TaxID=43657 RepID=A0A0C1QU42_9GAMM|nr:hypothetical protein [Pseudoalteromonas luteoviolacea]KID58497.1 hypothetical protein JF50_07525 [Pseudoalteromonas luteoviolacea]
MKYIQGIVLLYAFCFASFGQSREIPVRNMCGPSAQMQPELNQFRHYTMSANTDPFQPTEKAGVRFLGFDVTESAGGKNLTARFAGQDDLAYAFVEVYSGDFPLLCGEIWGSEDEKNLAWAIDIDLSAVPTRLNPEGEVEILLFSYHHANGEDEERFRAVAYDKQALLALVNHRSETTLPYQLNIAHPSNLVPGPPMEGVIYCLNSNHQFCDYSQHRHPKFADDPLVIHGIAVPFKGQFTLDGYVSSILYKEDITLDMKVMATDFGIWNRSVSEPIQLGALHPNSKAFLSQFITLSHSVDAETGEVQSTIAWDIPIEHGEFLSTKTYARDYNTHLLYNFAVQKNPLGSLQDALSRGYTEAQYHAQTKTRAIAMAGVYLSIHDTLKLGPLIVTFP